MAEKEQKDGEKGHTGRWKFRWTKSSSWTCCDDQEKNNLICSLYIREEAKQMGFIVGAAVRGMEGSNILDGEIESINSAQGIVVKWSNGTTTGMCYTPEKLQQLIKVYREKLAREQAAREEQATDKARQMGFLVGGAVLGIFSNDLVKGKIKTINSKGIEVYWEGKICPDLYTPSNLSSVVTIATERSQREQAARDAKKAKAKIDADALIAYKKAFTEGKDDSEIEECIYTAAIGAGANKNEATNIARTMAQKMAAKVAREMKAKEEAAKKAKEQAKKAKEEAEKAAKIAKEKARIQGEITKMKNKFDNTIDKAKLELSEKPTYPFCQCWLEFVKMESLEPEVERALATVVASSIPECNCLDCCTDKMYNKMTQYLTTPTNDWDKKKVQAMKTAEEVGLFDSETMSETIKNCTTKKTGVSSPEEKVTSVVNYQLTTNDALIRAEENVARALYVANRAEAVSKGPFWKLINVYDELDTFRASTADSEYGSIYNHYSEYGVSRAKYPANENQDLRIEPNKADFLENFNFISGGLFTHVDWRNTFVAGGAVLAAMQRRPKFINDIKKTHGKEIYLKEMKYWHRYQSGTSGNTTEKHKLDSNVDSYEMIDDFVEDNNVQCGDKKDQKSWKSRNPKLSSSERTKMNRGKGFRKGRSRFGESDIDIFVYGLTASDATKKLISLTEQIRRAGADASLNPYACYPKENAPQILAVKTENAVTYITTAIHPHLQIILRVYCAPAEILMGFDVDSCCVGFDGTNAWALPRARRAITLSANVADPARESRTYEVRLAKYAKRGFKVLTPGFQTKDVDRRIYMLPMRDLQGLARLMRLEMLDMMKVPCKLYNELGVRGRSNGVGGDRYPTKSDPNLNNFRIFEYLAESLIRESDYSSTYLPSGPGWNAASVLLNIIAGGEQRRMTFDSVGIDLVQGAINPRASRRYREHQSNGYIRHAVCGNLDYILRSLSWMTVDPGRQYVTGSFHPLEYDWYEQALAVEEYEPTANRLMVDDEINNLYRLQDHNKSARQCAMVAFEAKQTVIENNREAKKKKEERNISVT